MIFPRGYKVGIKFELLPRKQISRFDCLFYKALRPLPFYPNLTTLELQGAYLLNCQQVTQSKTESGGRFGSQGLLLPVPRPAAQQVQSKRSLQCVQAPGRQIKPVHVARSPPSPAPCSFLPRQPHHPGEPVHPAPHLPLPPHPPLPFRLGRSAAAAAAAAATLSLSGRRPGAPVRGGGKMCL